MSRKRRARDSRAAVGCAATLVCALCELMSGAAVANTLDAVFADDTVASNRVCLGDGSGAFTCSDGGLDSASHVAVALGSLTPVPVPALSFRGSLVAFLLFLLGGGFVLRRRWGRLQTNSSLR